MSNIISIQSEMVIMKNDIPVWRNPQSLSDDDLFAEYRAIKCEVRRRAKNESVH